MCTHPVFLKGICILKIFKVTFFFTKNINKQIVLFQSNSESLLCMSFFPMAYIYIVYTYCCEIDTAGAHRCIYNSQSYIHKTRVCQAMNHF